jgi:hypothetical protein
MDIDVSFRRKSTHVERRFLKLQYCLTILFEQDMRGIMAREMTSVQVVGKASENYD